MSQLQLFRESLKKEGLKPALLRALKAFSKALSRFIDYFPYAFASFRTAKVTKVVNGYKMNLHLHDKGISKELFTYGKREHLSTDIMLEGKVIKPGDVVLDLGANIGYYALMESMIVGNEGKVYAVEPSPVNYEMLKENIEVNGFTNIEKYNLAMGDHSGKADMYLSKCSNWARLVDKNPNDKIHKVVKVDISTVDEFLKNRVQPSMIRMDVEGYEIKIFRGMKQTLQNEKLSIFIELHPMFMTEEENLEIFNILEENNFEVKFCLLNPSLIRNPITEFAYKHLGESGDYDGIIYEMTLQEAKKWVRTHNFKRLPHFLFQKGGV
jgi:FkbM family methyltransferase